MNNVNIEKVEEEIVIVVNQIIAVDSKIDQCIDAEDKNYLRREKEQLRTKEQQLRREKEQLLEEKLLLLRAPQTHLGSKLHIFFTLA